MQKSLISKLFVAIIVALLIPNLHFASASQGTRIEISSIDINAEVVPLYVRDLPHGTTWDTRSLTYDVGYLTGTGWFGQNNNVVLGGHSELDNREPSVFYNLDKVQIGDVISVHANGTTYQYSVASLEWVDPSNLNSVMPTGHDQLTIITCDTQSFDGDSYNKRLIVRALPV